MASNNSTPAIYDIAIVGAGPAGLTAAIYAQRAEAKAAVIDGGAPGGKMVKTSDIVNYPGFSSILGPDLAVNMFLQTQELQVPLLGANVTEIIPSPQKPFQIKLSDGKTIKSWAVIVATGTIERLVGAIGEREFYGKGVSNCAVCDGAFFRDQPVVVIGGGYAALEEGIYLTKFASKVTIVHRRQGFRADAGMVRKAKANPKIEFMLDYVLKKVIGDKEVSGALIENVITKKELQLPCKAVFPFIGSDPVTGFLEDLKILDEMGYIKVNSRGETHVPGLFAAGDATNTVLRQIATAVSDGAKAGQFAIHYIDKVKENHLNN